MRTLRTLIPVPPNLKCQIFRSIRINIMPLYPTYETKVKTLAYHVIPKMIMWVGIYIFFLISGQN